MTTTSYTIQHQVAKEAGTSFRNVVRFYADQGHSIAETALMLGYGSQSAFNRLCHRHGWVEWFRAPTETIGFKRAKEARKGLSTPALVAAASRATEARNVPRYDYNGVTDTLTGHAKRLNLPIRRVYSRWQRHKGDLDYALFEGTHASGAGRKIEADHVWRL